MSACLLFSGGSQIAGAARENNDEQRIKLAKIKSAYLLNFLKYTHWPNEAFPEKGTPIRLAVLGNDPLGKILDLTMQGKTVAKRPIQISRMHWPEKDRYREKQDHEKALQQCLEHLNQQHMLFLCASERERIETILSRLDPKHLLTVGDHYDLVDAGTMIGLTLEKGRVVFYANTRAMEQTRAKVSSKVLRLARLIHKED